MQHADGNAQVRDSAHADRSDEGTNTTTLKGAVAGCTDPNVNGGNSFFGGALTGTITTNGGSACGSLQGLSSNTGTATITWKPPKGFLFTPVNATTLKPQTITTFTQSQGLTYTVSGEAPWAASYGQFELGTAYGTTALSTVGANQDFAGHDSGASGWFNGVTQQDVGAIVGACTGSGLKSVSFGIGGTVAG